MTYDAQRALIIAGAQALFLRNGYGRTTTDEIAAQCKISKQTLYRLFPSKLALFIAIVETHRQSMLAMPAKCDDLPLDIALEQIFRIDIDPTEDADRLAFLQLVLIEGQQFPELKDILHQYGATRAHAELARWLSRMRQRRLIHIDDARSAAHILMDMIFGTIIAKSIHHKETPAAGSRRMHIRRCIRIFLNGVKTEREHQRSDAIQRTSAAKNSGPAARANTP